MNAAEAVALRAATEAALEEISFGADYIKCPARLRYAPFAYEGPGCPCGFIFPDEKPFLDAVVGGNRARSGEFW